jgi:hypothetical protein
MVACDHPLSQKADCRNYQDSFGCHPDSVLINYPADEKRQWDSVVTRISNTLASR